MVVWPVHLGGAVDPQGAGTGDDAARRKSWRHCSKFSDARRPPRWPCAVAPSVTGALIEVVPLLALMAPPKMTAGGAAHDRGAGGGGIGVEGPVHVHSVGPLTVSVEPLPRSVTDRHVPSESMCGRVDGEGDAGVDGVGGGRGDSPSQSKVSTSMVVLAATWEEPRDLQGAAAGDEVTPLNVLGIDQIERRPRGHREGGRGVQGAGGVDAEDGAGADGGSAGEGDWFAVDLGGAGGRHPPSADRMMRPGIAGGGDIQFAAVEHDRCR